MTNQLDIQPKYSRRGGKWLRMLLVGVILLLVEMPVMAQMYSTSKQTQGAYMSTTSYHMNNRVMSTTVDAPAYRPYQSTIYEPFSSTSPMQRARGDKDTPNGPNIGNDLPADVEDPDDEMPDDFGNVDDPGDALPLSGELWVLLVLAALATVLKTIKLRKQKI